MPKTPSSMNLHLRYRLWIAEMNSDINVLRIFDDYIAEITHAANNTEAAEGIEKFKNKFIDLRKEIDEMRHEMHLHKMKLAAWSRENKEYTPEDYRTDNHAVLEKRYINYKKDFEQVKTNFGSFASKWLH